MFEKFLPKKFCREFVEIKGYSGQLTMIMATVKGIKPCMDDWVKADRYEQYRKICKRYGLIVKPDSVFDIIRDTKELPLNIIGKDQLTTTRAFGSRLNNRNKKGLVHLFLSRSRRALNNTFRNGWYPLIIEDRVIEKPLIDIFKFGYGLGYPECCVDFFQKYNNWQRYSYLYEIFRNSSKEKYDYLCNPFTKDITYSYIYHMPCSFDCGATADLAVRIRSAIYEEEPEFAKRIDEHLRLPVLVFYERKFYAFKGEIKHGRLYYTDVYFIGQMSEKNLYEDDLRKGSCVFLDNKDVVILDKGKLVKRIVWQKKDFAPETPFIIQFN